MIEKTVTDELGIKKASVKLTLPVIEIDCYRKDEADLNNEIRLRLVDVVDQMISKNLT